MYPINVLMISSDANALKEGSETWKRLEEYRKCFQELRVLVSGGRFLDFWRIYRDGKRILKGAGRWVITAQDPFEHGLIANCLAEEFNLPFQLQIHTDFLSRFFVRGSLKNRFRVWLAKMLLPEADGIRVVSPRISEAIIKSGLVDPARITVLPIFVDKDTFSSASPESREWHRIQEDDFLIVTAGRRAKEKNMDLANDIVSELKRRGHKIKWLHVGYEEKKANAFLENSPTVAPFYKMADLFLLTSNYEGYGMVAVEAAAAGIPVVMTDVGVALGSVFPVGDRDRAVEVIEDLIKNPEKKAQLVARQNTFFENWPTKEEYVDRYAKSLDLHYFDRLLFITQKVDLDDDVLGVYHNWIEKFAGVFKKVSVISLYKGRVELPGRIAVHSLGKESGRSLLKYVFRFYKNLWRLRGQYDAVFVHMNSEYMLLAGLLWKLSGKKVLFWYNHPQGNWKARIGFALADNILHTSPFAFSANRRKSVRMPVGIDTDIFRSDAGIPKKPNSILCLGRISPIKYIETLIEAANILDKNNLDFSVTIAGAPSKESERPYAESLKNQAKELVKKGRVVFREAVPNYQTPGIYNSHMIYANMTPTGSFDKAILEAMACELTVVASNKAVADVLLAQLRFEEREAVSLARALEYALGLSHEERKRIGLAMRGYVTESHDLGTLVKRVREVVK